MVVNCLSIFILIACISNCVLIFGSNSSKNELYSFTTREDLKKLEPKLNEKKIEKDEVKGNLVILFNGQISEIKKSFILKLSKDKPRLMYAKRKAIFLKGTNIPPIAVPFYSPIPAYKELSEEVFLFPLTENFDSFEVPEGEYYASLSNGEIEEGKDIGIYPLFPRWNQGYLATFGYEYNYEIDEFKEFNGKCRYESVKNIHWISSIYDPRGSNLSICPKLVVQKGKTTRLNIKSSSSELQYTRSFLAWLPGILVLAPLIYGSSMSIIDYELDVRN